MLQSLDDISTNAAAIAFIQNSVLILKIAPFQLETWSPSIFQFVLPLPNMGVCINVALFIRNKTVTAEELLQFYIL